MSKKIYSAHYSPLKDVCSEITVTQNVTNQLDFSFQYFIHQLSFLLHFSQHLFIRFILCSFDLRHFSPKPHFYSLRSLSSIRSHYPRLTSIQQHTPYKCFDNLLPCFFFVSILGCLLINGLNFSGNKIMYYMYLGISKFNLFYV